MSPKRILVDKNTYKHAQKNGSVYLRCSQCREGEFIQYKHLRPPTPGKRVPCGTWVSSQRINKYRCWDCKDKDRQRNGVATGRWPNGTARSMLLDPTHWGCAAVAPKQNKRISNASAKCDGSNQSCLPAHGSGGHEAKRNVCNCQPTKLAAPKKSWRFSAAPPQLHLLLPGR